MPPLRARAAIASLLAAAALAIAAAPAPAAGLRSCPGVDDVATQADGGVVVAGYDATCVWSATAQAPTGEVGKLPFLARFTAGGALDTRFGDGGVAEVAAARLPDGSGEAMRIATLPSGRLVVSGRDFVAELEPDGRLNQAFGDRGVTGIRFGGRGSGAVEIGAMATTGDGSVLVAGSGGPGGPALEKLRADGYPDASFGDDGVLDLGSVIPGRAPRSIGGIGVSAYGSILLGGIFGAGEPGVLALDTGGRPQSGFGDSGLARLPLPGGASAPSDRIADLSVGGGGEITLLGRSRAGTGSSCERPFSGRLSGGGRIVRSISVFAACDGDTGRAFHADGTIDMAGGGGANPAGRLQITRYLPGGAPDRRFGAAGTAGIAVPGGGGTARAAALRADGRVVVAGVRRIVGCVDIGAGAHADCGRTLLVGRLLPDGSADAGFGRGGLVEAPVLSCSDGFGVNAAGDRVCTVGPSLPRVRAKLRYGSSPSPLLRMEIRPNGGTAGAATVQIRTSRSITLRPAATAFPPTVTLGGQPLAPGLLSAKAHRIDISIPLAQRRLSPIVVQVPRRGLSPIRKPDRHRSLPVSATIGYTDSAALLGASAMVRAAKHGGNRFRRHIHSARHKGSCRKRRGSRGRHGHPRRRGKRCGRHRGKHRHGKHRHGKHRHGKHHRGKHRGGKHRGRGHSHAHRRRGRNGRKRRARSGGHRTD